MKLCIIGNSHIACLRNAWREEAEITQEHEVIFFGATGARLTKLKASVEDRCLIAEPPLTEQLQQTSGGLGHIATDDYDAFVIVGLSNSVHDLVSAFTGAKYSMQVQAEATRDFWVSRNLFPVVNLLRSVCDKPIYIIHSPLEALPAPLPVPISTYDDMIRTSQTQVFNDFGAKLLQQPNSTLNGGMATKRKFSSGSVRLNLRNDGRARHHPQEDIEHMNADFGGIMLKTLRGELMNCN